MAIRRTLAIAGLSLTVLGTSVTCSLESRRRVLLFFCDGCPPPGPQPARRGYTIGTAGASEATEAGVVEPLRPVKPVYAHAPYRDERCGGCHHPVTGDMLRTPQQGLCRSCHPDIPGQDRYVHGPVAVDACLFCHHPHNSVHPKLLLFESTELCFRCHSRRDLTGGPHHQTVGDRACVECHHPHGGDHPLFLRRPDQ